MQWRGVEVVVTGGASFIGSHLVGALVDRGARVRVVSRLADHGGRTMERTRLIDAARERLRYGIEGSWPPIGPRG